MDKVRSAITIIAFSLLSLGCDSQEYRPLADGQAVYLKPTGLLTPYLLDGVEMRGDAEAYLSNPDVDFELGIRASKDGMYLPDTFVVDDGIEETTLNCWAAHDTIENDFESAFCRNWFQNADPGREIRIQFNDFPESVIAMPEITPLSSPMAGSEVSLSTEGLVLSWEPLGKGDRMAWWLIGGTFQDSEACHGEASAWSESSGEMEDTGSFIVPAEELPTDIPNEGCPVTLRFNRGRAGTLDPGIKLGSIIGRQEQQFQFTLKP